MGKRKASDCLIVAVDFTGTHEEIHEKIMELAEQLKGTNVYLKLNSALRKLGYGIIKELHDMGIRVFADLKLIDIPNTMENDGESLVEFRPDILTVMCAAGVRGMEAIKNQLPDTEVLGVTILTSLTEEECQFIYGCSVKAGVLKLSYLAQLSGLDGLIMSAAEADFMQERSEVGIGFNTPGIRPIWYQEQDDQNKKRIRTPAEAIKAGVNRVVIGRPITKSKNIREAVSKTLQEIDKALKEKEIKKEKK